MSIDTNIVHQLTPDLIAVEVPQNATHLSVYDKESLPVALLVCFEDALKNSPYPIVLPNVKWEILGTADKQNLSFDTEPCVEKKESESSLNKHFVYRDYTESKPTFNIFSADSSFRTLLISKGIYWTTMDMWQELNSKYSSTLKKECKNIDGKLVILKKMSYSFEPSEELITFATYFSENYKELSTGRYVSKDNSYQLKYADKLRVEAYGELPESDGVYYVKVPESAEPVERVFLKDNGEWFYKSIGDPVRDDTVICWMRDSYTGARTNTQTAEIEIDKTIFSNELYTKDFVFFIVLWCVAIYEIEAYSGYGNGFLEADLSTLHYYLKTGRSKKELIVGWSTLFLESDENSKEKTERLKAMDRLAYEHDINKEINNEMN